MLERWEKGQRAGSGDRIMSFGTDRFDYMDLADFEELLADKPRDEKWEPIGAASSG